MNYVMVTLGNIAKEKKTMTDEYLLERGYKQYKPHDYVPVSRRDKWWNPFTYHYETQVTMFEGEKALNLEFFSDWTLEEVEKFMEDMFEKMKLNYYESWSGNRRVRPDESE